MGLTNKQFDTIMQQYDELQSRNHALIAAREKEIDEKLPLYKKLGKDLNAIRVSRTRALLSKNKELISQCEGQEHAIIAERKQLLMDNGYPEDYLSAVYDCDICKDTGFVPESQQKCRCFIKAQTKLLFEQSGIAHLIDKQNFDTLSMQYFNEAEAASYQNAVTVAKNFVTNFNSDYQNLLFYGNVGTGKTFLSCCIAKELMEQGISVTYCSAVQLFNMLVDLRFQDDKDEYFSFIEEINDRDLLIIDDLGTENITDRVKSDLFTCLNNRDISKKATIISTNLSIKDLKTRYSERIASRISSHFYLCRLDGSDIRIKKKLQGN